MTTPVPARRPAPSGRGAMIGARAPVAQRIEQVPSKHLVAGSIPAGRATCGDSPVRAVHGEMWCDGDVPRADRPVRRRGHHDRAGGHAAGARPTRHHVGADRAVTEEALRLSWAAPCSTPWPAGGRDTASGRARTEGPRGLRGPHRRPPRRVGRRLAVAGSDTPAGVLEPAARAGSSPPPGRTRTCSVRARSSSSCRCRSGTCPCLCRRRGGPSRSLR